MRRFIVTASYTQEMDVIVYVPNKWDSSDIMQHYKEKGACGEFNEDPEDCSWSWGEATEIEEDEYKDRIVFNLI